MASEKLLGSKSLKLPYPQARQQPLQQWAAQDELGTDQPRNVLPLLDLYAPGVPGKRESELPRSLLTQVLQSVPRGQALHSVVLAVAFDAQGRQLKDAVPLQALGPVCYL